MELQTSLVIVHGAKVAPGPLTRDHYQREPFRHPALEGLEGLHMTHKQQATDKKRLAQLGERYGLNHVLRWKPKNVGGSLPIQRYLEELADTYLDR